MENLIFSNLNLSEEVQKAITEMGFEEATPIQSQSIPYIMEGKDVIGQAQTGTGKTCAFGIPAIEMLDPNESGIQVLVLCPTRELAIQTAEEIKSVAKYKEGVKILPVYGGQSIERQITALRNRPQIVIGTPGRIMDHMRRKTLKLENLKMIILDEADEMLNMGFREDIDVILEKVPEEKQTIFFSATMPKGILDLTKKYQREPIHVKTAHKEMTVSGIEQFYLEVTPSVKLEVLARIIDTNNSKLSLVFCNTKRRVDEVTSGLQSRGYSAEALHGDLRQESRDKVMAKFRNGTLDVLIATDVAARGIDVDDIETVFNYDVPNDEEYYVHRIGRTGRAGRTGKAFTFVVGREIYKLRDIMRYTKAQIKIMKPPTLVDVEENKMSQLLEDVKAGVRQGHFAKYEKYIEKIMEELNATDVEDEIVSTIDVAAALMKMFADQNSKEIQSHPELDAKGGFKAVGVRTNSTSTFRNDRPGNDRGGFDRNNSNDRGSRFGKEGGQGGRSKEAGMVRLFLNLGRGSQIQPNHIVESIASNTSIPGKKIGAIDIFDKFTFFDVPEEYADEIINTMKEHKIKGKRVNIEKSNKRTDSRPEKKPGNFAPRRTFNK